MILHPWPDGLRWTSWTFAKRSGVIGTTEGFAGDEQAVTSRDGRVGFDITLPAKRGALARAWRGIESAARDGIDAIRWRHCDPDRPGAAIGYRLTGAQKLNGLPWSEGYAWEEGFNWAYAPPHAALWAAAAEDADEIRIDTVAWGGVLEAGTWIGFPGVLAMHIVEEVRWSGAVATCRIWPVLRRGLGAGTMVTLRPTIAVKLVKGSGQWSRGALQDGQSASFVEVHDRVIRTYATALPRPAAPAWYLAEAWRAADGTRPMQISLYDQGLYALPDLAAGAVAAANPTELATLAAVAFGDGIALSATSGGTARTYVTEALGVGTDIAVDAPRFDWLGSSRAWLLENASTNIVSRAIEADQWSTNASPNDTTVTANAALAPDGTMTADLVIAPATLGGHSRYKIFTGAINTRYAFEKAFKNGGDRYVAIELSGTGFGAATRRMVVDLDTGLVTDSTGPVIAYHIDALGDGWWLVRIENDSDADGGFYVAAYFVMGSPTLANIVWTGDGVSGIYVWGGHLHAGAGRDSLILSGASTLTRAIETATETALARALACRSAWTGVLTFVPRQVDDGVIWQADDGSTNNRIMVSVTAGVVSLSIRTGGVAVFLASASTPIVAGVEATVAWRCRRGRNRIVIGGGGQATPTTDTGGALPVGLTQASIARNMAGTLRYCAGRYRKLLKYPAAVSDAALAALSA